VHESTIVSFPPPTCIAHPGAILSHEYWTVYDSPSDLPLCMLYTIQYWEQQYRVKAKLWRRPAKQERLHPPLPYTDVIDYIYMYMYIYLHIYIYIYIYIFSLN